MKKIIILVVAVVFALFAFIGCEIEEKEPTSATGVKKVTSDVVVQASGMTVEQENIDRRTELENVPGAIKHLYIISAYSGQVLIYSTVKGKVTSSGKRLSPYTVESAGESPDGFPITINGQNYHTLEVLQDDGTYGHSIPYLYWWDVRGGYHQHYITGGQIPHLSDKPLVVKDVIINMEIQ